LYRHSESRGANVRPTGCGRVIDAPWQFAVQQTGSVRCERRLSISKLPKALR
jgi:hypothetical protein